MPSFCKCGADQYMCQLCASVNCSKDEPSEWLKISIAGSGNVCPTCNTPENFGITQEEAAKTDYKLESGVYSKVIDNIRISAVALPNGNCPVGARNFKIENVKE